MLRRHSNIVALLLLLAFSQKVGVRLWVHHWLHETTTASKTNPNTESVRLLCDCFDDAMLPIQEAAVFTVDVPVLRSTPLTAPDGVAVLSIDKIYYSLKGPPFRPFCA